MNIIKRLLYKMPRRHLKTQIAARKYINKKVTHIDFIFDKTGKVTHIEVEIIK